MGRGRGSTFLATIDRISNKGNGVVEKDSGGHLIVGKIKEQAVGQTVKMTKTGHNKAELIDPNLRKDVFAAQEMSETDDAGGAALSDSAQSDIVLYEELSGSDPGAVTCPVTDCSYTGKPASVAGHVSGMRDDEHTWGRLGYGGAYAFKDTVTASTEPPESTTHLLHLSDSHLGASRTPDSNYTRRNPCLKGFRRAIDVAIDQGVDGVLNTGDLFHNDRHGIPEDVKEAARTQLQRLEQRAISFYSIEGNHERKKGRAVLESFEREGIVTRLDEEPQLVGDGIALYGRDYVRSEKWTGAGWSPSSRPANRYGVLAVHQSIAPISNSDRPECTVKDIATVAKPDVQAIALGHLHKTGVNRQQELPFILGGTTDPDRAGRNSNDPMVGLFIQPEGGSLRYQRLELSIEESI
jgi:hypothetical protein